MQIENVAINIPAVITVTLRNKVVCRSSLLNQSYSKRMLYLLMKYYQMHLVYVLPSFPSLPSLPRSPLSPSLPSLPGGPGGPGGPAGHLALTAVK